MEGISAELRNRLLDEGVNVAGYSEIPFLPDSIEKDLRIAISLGIAIQPSIVRAIINGPTKEYFEEYHRLNRKLSEVAQIAVGVLTSKGYHAVALAPSGIDYDPDTLSTSFSHKTAAVRAGLGWIGKSALLVTKEYGTALRLTTILTNAPLSLSFTDGSAFCGECNECTHACPANAITGQAWVEELPRDRIVDAFACRADTRSRANKIGIDLTLCGVCIAVCPWTQRYVSRFTANT